MVLLLLDLHVQKVLQRVILITLFIVFVVLTHLFHIKHLENLVLNQLEVRREQVLE